MTDTKDTNRDTKPKSKRIERLSPDGKWRSFPKVPNLLQYVSTGLYFARVKVNGKLIRRGLQTKVFEDAKLLLHDFLTRETKTRHVTGAPATFGEARGLYESSLTNDPTLSEQGRYYRRNCIKHLLKSWPGLDGMKPRAITRHQCEDWASKLAASTGSAPPAVRPTKQAPRRRNTSTIPLKQPPNLPTGSAFSSPICDDLRRYVPSRFRRKFEQGRFPHFAPGTRMPGAFLHSHRSPHCGHLV